MTHFWEILRRLRHVLLMSWKSIIWVLLQTWALNQFCWKVCQCFWLTASFWNKVHFPWGKLFHYGTNLQLRRPLLQTPWVTMDRRTWKAFLCLLRWSSSFKSTYLSEMSKLKQGNPEGWLEWLYPLHCPLYCLLCSCTICPMMWARQRSETAEKE